MHCLSCNINFESKHKDARFCCNKCYVRWKAQQKRDASSKTCKYCTKTFKPERFFESDRQLFCCFACQSDWHKLQKRECTAKIFDTYDKLKSCNYCEKQFEIGNIANIDYQRFCSRECKSEWHKKKRREEFEAIRKATIKTCPICEIQFTPSKQLTQIYCSKKCCYLFPKRAYSALSKCLKLSGTNKEGHAHDVLGFTPKELQQHIQSHPNWSLVKDKEWHLDHVFPIIAFIEHDIKDIKMMCCLKNLQPLLSKDNMRKSGKYNKTEFESWLQQFTLTHT